MTSAVREPTPKRRLQTAAVAELRVSPYDRVASLLIALLILIGFAVFSLFLIWLTNQIFVTQTAVPVLMEDIGGGREDGVIGESMEIDAPDVSEIAAESDLTEPQIQDALALITDAVSTLQADLTDPAESDNFESGGGGRSTGDGRQVGLGSGEGEPGIPRAQRWEIHFQEGGSLDLYARQLDFFGIELGVVGSGNQIHYAYNLSKPKPDTRTAPGAEEKRLYMSWRQGSLQQADRELLNRAGINHSGRIVVQFYPPETENQLAVIERDYRGLEPTQIRKTRFGVKSSGGGFAFYVIDQTAF